MIYRSSNDEAQVGRLRRSAVAVGIVAGVGAGSIPRTGAKQADGATASNRPRVVAWVNTEAAALAHRSLPGNAFETRPQE
jgi:hypothetical protein